MPLGLALCGLSLPGAAQSPAPVAPDAPLAPVAPGQGSTAPSPVRPTASAGRLLSFASAMARSGAPLLALSTPDSPAALVQLHLRIPEAEITPRQRAALSLWAAGLAMPAQAGLRTAGGSARGGAWGESVVLSYSVPADQLDVALRALDLTIQGRSRPPATPAPALLALAADEAIPPEVLALACPGHPLASSVGAAGDPPFALDAPLMRSLADAFFASDRVAVVVAGPLPAEELLAHGRRLLVAPLPARGPGLMVVPLQPTQGTIVWEDPRPPDENGLNDAPGALALDARPGSAAGLVSASVWALARLEGDPVARARRALVARLLGGRAAGSERLFGVKLQVSATSWAHAPRAEGEALARLRRLARTPPAAEELEVARAAERSARLSAFRDPERIALFLGQAALRGNPEGVEAEFSALDAVTGPEIAQTAQAMLWGPRVVLRRLGGPP